MSTRQATREKLLEAAEKVFAEKGYYEAAVDEIVRKSSTSKGSVYFHFPTKESLFLAVLDHLGERLVQRVEGKISQVTDPTQRLNVALTTTLETLTKHRTLARLLLSKGVGTGSAFARKRTDLFGRFASLIEGLLREAVAATGTSPLNLEVVSHAWLGAVSEVVVTWLETGRPHPIRESLPTLRGLFLNGMGLHVEEPGSSSTQQREGVSALSE